MEGAAPRSEALAGVTDGHRRVRWARWIVLAVVVAGLVAGGWAWRASRARAAATAAQRPTATVTRGDLAVTITAVGTLQPSNVVSVGSELSGIVAEVEVDANDTVTAGQSLARLDTSVLTAQEQQAAAAVRAGEAAVVQARVNLDAATREAARAQALVASGAATPSDQEQAETTRDLARSALAVAQAQVAQARATWSAASTNLRKAEIRSPIAGVVLERNVERGQAVVSSLQATTLFKVAEDLRRMRLTVSVDEADVGQVVAGQHADFTVAAWPDRVFPAEVTKVHLSPDATQQVVTYVAELGLDNPDLVLLPGMTATVRITAKTWPDALLVPNAALRYVPAERDLPAPEPRDGRRYARVWTPAAGGETPVEVVPLATNGKQTVIEPGPLAVGAEVIVAGAPEPPAAGRLGPPHD